MLRKFIHWEFTMRESIMSLWGRHTLIFAMETILFLSFLKTKEYTHKLGDGFSNSFLKNLNSCFKVIDTWFYVCECVCVGVCVCSVRNLYAMMEIKRNMGTEYGFLGLRSWLSFSTMLCSVGSCWSLDGPYSFWVTHIKYPLFSCTSLTAFST